jgi:MSHA biogenesis protein MshO
MNVVAPCVVLDNLPCSSKKELTDVGRSLLRQKNGTVVFRQKFTQQGFTLVELIMVIVLLGVMAVGVSSFIGLSTQTYINVAQRDELVASARFAIERLNREVRNAVPNSIRINSNSTTQCLEFLPIVASTNYVDIAVAPEPASNTFTVIPFVDNNNNTYVINNNDVVVVYPLYPTDIYTDLTDNTGKIFGINAINTTAIPWVITLDHIVSGGIGDVFSQDSPNKRLYIANTPVSYCANNGNLIRYNNYNITANNYILPNGANSALMAENLATVSSLTPIFTIQPATLKRNAQVQIKLDFTQDGEHVIFANDIHLVNVP